MAVIGLSILYFFVNPLTMWLTFATFIVTDPEVARVGINELEAREKKIEYTISKYGIEDLDRAITEGEAHGFVKVLTPPGSDKVLGVTIVGDHAGDIIVEYVAAMKHGFGRRSSRC